MENSIVIVEREKIIQLGKQISAMLPNSGKLNDNERWALAQVALAHNLDPFTGEVYYMSNRGVFIGIAGRRKLARRQMAAEGGSYWTYFRQIGPDHSKTACFWQW